MTSTDLRSKLNVLRQKSVALSDQLSKLEEEVKTKKEQRERQGPKDMAQAQTELIKFRRELEVSHADKLLKQVIRRMNDFQVRNRLNATQNIKLKTQKELLSEKQQLLAEKKKELEQIKLRKQQAVSGDRHVKYKSPERHPSNTQGREFTIRHTPLSASGRREQAVSSASKKRHSSIFEVKTRQLVEEESQAFLKLHAQKLDFDEEDDENNNITTQQPPIDYQQVSSTPSRVDHLPTNNSSTHIKKRGKTRTRLTLKKQVQFTADSIILNAALEGELDMLKQCTRKVRKTAKLIRHP